MSAILWKYFLEDDVESFGHLLKTAPYTTRQGAQKGHGSSADATSFSTSPTHTKGKGRESEARNIPAGLTLTRADVNYRDAFGRTLLHLAAASTAATAYEFAVALLEHPLTDIFLQDAENGWTALHRALYAGNVAIARCILARDAQDSPGYGSGSTQRAGGLIKVKDREGNGPFDVYELTLEGHRHQHDRREPRSYVVESSKEERSDDEYDVDAAKRSMLRPNTRLYGDELFTFGSNKNLTLGFGDEDDRQFPERLQLKRAESAYEHMQDRNSHNRIDPVLVFSVHMAKLHTAVLVHDKGPNLLGLGDERTRFQLQLVEGGTLASKSVRAVALGQNHTLAIDTSGSVHSWGSNDFAQLGYSLSKGTVQTLPRQLFGPLKREYVIGVAASRIHSVIYTESALFTFGKNEGQLGLMDADARSLEIQDTPRRVAPSLLTADIRCVTATDRATCCVLQNKEVWVFANYGYAKVHFPVPGLNNKFLSSYKHLKSIRPDMATIRKVVSEGDTICALSEAGDIFRFGLTKAEGTSNSGASTTNPRTLRSSLSKPQRIWSMNKGHMAARDVAMDQNGCIILATQAGSVWHQRKKAHDSSTADRKNKDYKYSRIPGLTRISAICASGFGAYAAVREDCEKMDKIYWHRGKYDDDGVECHYNDWFLAQDGDEFFRYDHHSFWVEDVLKSDDPDSCLRSAIDDMRKPDIPFDAIMYSVGSSVRIPFHKVLLAMRSPVVRNMIHQLELNGMGSICHRGRLEISKVDGLLHVVFTDAKRCDPLTLANLVMFLCESSVRHIWGHSYKGLWHHEHYRRTRAELLDFAKLLEIRPLERCIKGGEDGGIAKADDIVEALSDFPAFGASADVVVQLADGEALVHSFIVTRRSRFFESLILGSSGTWFSERRRPRDDLGRQTIDLRHISCRAFKYAQRHMYAGLYEDTFDWFFDDVVADTAEEFLETVLDILGAADELMLDELCGDCQHAIGHYVTVRNVCQLLGKVSQFCMKGFQRSALKYICFNLEAVLQYGRFDELSEDMLFELTKTLRHLQTKCLPIRGREPDVLAALHARHPGLQRRIDREWRAKIDSMVRQGARSVIDGSRFATVNPPHPVADSPRPAVDKRPAANDTNARDYPLVLDEDLLANKKSRYGGGSGFVATSPGEAFLGRPDSPPRRHASLSDSPYGPALRASSSAWDVFHEAPPQADTDARRLTPVIQDPYITPESSRTPRLPPHNSYPDLPVLPKLSQKERKRLQAERASAPQPNPDPSSSSSKNPWQQVPKKASKLTELFAQAGTSPRPQLTMRQTVANPAASGASVSGGKAAVVAVNRPGSSGAGISSSRAVPLATSVGTPPANGKAPAIGPAPVPSAPRGSSTPAKATGGIRCGAPGMPSAAGVASTPMSSSHPSASHPAASHPSASHPPAAHLSPAPIQSIRHTPKPGPSTTPFSSYQLSMAAILTLQQDEKDAAAAAREKRDLRDIQAEQEFQEWWDKETHRKCPSPQHGDSM
ncbi:hypothetical protein EJ06DRAFT_550183 [Trichodelitschia bisporula]|uniref:Uncharacterized protein n=1 Tax=Trichodelitschia bisporula TaxID=703511 RepID=A0A6G1HSH6_9PEZI|nr:hypothetical protein EJ06DRAFT_550183 [Trichodelitschia bisporula]